MLTVYKPAKWKKEQKKTVLTKKWKELQSEWLKG